MPVAIPFGAIALTQEPVRTLVLPSTNKPYLTQEAVRTLALPSDNLPRISQVAVPVLYLNPVTASVTIPDELPPLDPIALGPEPLLQSTEVILAASTGLAAGKRILARFIGFANSQPIYEAPCNPLGVIASGQRYLARLVGYQGTKPVFEITGCTQLAAGQKRLARLTGSTLLPGTGTFLPVYESACCGGGGGVICQTLVWARFAPGDFSGVADFYRDLGYVVDYIGPGDQYPPGFNLGNYVFAVIILPSQWDSFVNDSTLKAWRTVFPASPIRDYLIVGGPRSQYLLQNTILNTLLISSGEWRFSNDDLDPSDPRGAVINHFNRIGYGLFQEPTSDGPNILTPPSSGPFNGRGLIVDNLICPNTPPLSTFQCYQDPRFTTAWWAVGNISSGGIFGSQTLLGDSTIMERIHTCYKYVNCALSMSGYNMAQFSPPAELTITVSDVLPADGYLPPPNDIHSPAQPLLYIGITNLSPTVGSYHTWVRDEAEILPPREVNGFLYTPHYTGTFRVYIEQNTGCMICNMTFEYVYVNEEFGFGFNYKYRCHAGESQSVTSADLINAIAYFPATQPSYNPVFFDFLNVGLRFATNNNQYDAVADIIVSV